MATKTKKCEPKKRVKTVFSSKEIYHLWAHMKYPHGRCSGDSVFFEGTVIYSYGKHFPMGRLIVKNGRPVAVLLTTRRASVTTSAHQSSVRMAASHLKQFHVQDVDSCMKHTDNVRAYKTDIGMAAVDATRARSAKRYKLERLADLIREANEYADFFGLQTRFGDPNKVDADAVAARRLEELRTKSAREQAAEKRRRKKRLADYREAMTEYEPKVETWLNGGKEPFPREPIHPEEGYGRNRMARLRVRGSRIETSMGVPLSIEATKPILELVRKTDGVGDLVHDEMEIEGYRGVSINFDDKTVSVGCHTVAFDEVERIAKQLNL